MSTSAGNELISAVHARNGGTPFPLKVSSPEVGEATFEGLEEFISSSPAVHITPIICVLQTRIINYPQSIHCHPVCSYELCGNSDHLIGAKTIHSLRYL
jgi:hypothetical protein